MKILMLAPQPFYSERGTPMNVRLMCQVLGEAGYAVDLVVFPTGTPVDLPNVRILRLPNVLGVRAIPVGLSGPKLFYDALLFCYIPYLCWRTRYRVIHGVEEAGFLAVLFARLFGARAIFDMDSSISEQLAQGRFQENGLVVRLVRKVETWALRRADLVITVCEALSKAALALAPQARIVQIEDIPLTGCESSIEEESRVSLLLAQHLPAEAPYFLYTGNLEKYQGIDLLLAAWTIFRQHYDSAGIHRLVVVGGTAGQVERYRQVSAAAGHGGTVLFTGARSVREMAVWMAKAQALVSPRLEGENTPLKIYTYMDSGKPVLATRLRTHTQVLHDGVAFLADPEPAGFAQAMAAICAEPEVAAARAAEAQKLVAEKYSYQVFREKLTMAYDGLAAETRDSGDKS